MPKKTVSFRIEEELLTRLRTVAEQEYRTVGGQLTVLARKCVEQYENKQLKAAHKNEPTESVNLETA